ncbi:peptidoglycan-binding protein [Altibacter sp. HG106]|uniref:peptidoglycan-binding protein n=1 Tax=Altibacter sp. HG106 TaxID=3023937 RepID=UPI0023506743|nr:peptidoglycan-binding protein [Altibacter sp. HG106]MDC7994451.1 glycoside hydrolase family 19 protein [Altibacter sp. HG106]
MNRIIAFQHNNRLVADGIIGPATLGKMKEVFNIGQNIALAHFLGQLAHETASFTRNEESLNYSVSGLMKTFLFYRRNPDLARLHGRAPGQSAKQEDIANTVYADENRGRGYKLGNVHPGDGWKFRGRGAIMITGRSNYELFFKWENLPADTDPNLLATKYYWRTALWFFERNDVWRHCGQISLPNVKRVTKLINGGYNGLSHRYNLTRMYHALITA